MTTNPSISQARRAARVRKVVEEVMVRRAGGGILTDTQIIEEHPGLMPDLASELELLALLERAQPAGHIRPGSSAPGRSRDGVIPIAPDAFEGYEVVGEIHRGGQGVVYEATQKSTGRRVAVKVMREGLFGATAGGRDSARFEREVRILGQLDHPGIVGILASGVHAGHFYYVMDYITGLPLDEYAARRPLHERLQVLVKVCEAVSAPHLRGIIHRDLKPANILVDEQGQPHILDFGLARITAEWRADPRMTQTGQFVGSLPWSSPEQAAGNPDRIDIRTDVYSLGVLLYQAVSGRFPYRVEGGPRDVLDQILTASPARLRSFVRGIDDDLEAVALKCLAKERERRYQSAGELADDLRRVLDRRPVLARSPGVGYQVRSYMRRHTALVAGVAAVAATLVVGLIGTTVGLLEASAGRRAAEDARDTARDAEAIAGTRLEEARRLAYIAGISAADSALRAQDSAAAKARLSASPPALRDWEWSYLSGRTDESAEILNVPGVLHAAVSPDGQAAAVLSTDGALRVLDLRTRAVRWETSVPEAARAADEQQVVCFSRGGDLVATAHGGRIFVWRIGEPRPVAEVGFPGSTWGYITAAFEPGGSTLVANGRHRLMKIWNWRDGTLIRQFPQKTSYSGVDYSAGGSVLAVGSDHGLVLIDPTTGAESLVPAGAPVLSASVWPVGFSPDATVLAIAQGNDITLHSMPGGVARAVLRGHSQNVGALAFSPDGATLASVGWDRTVRIWDVASGSPVGVMIGHDGAVNSVGFVLGGTRLLTSSGDGTLRLWDIEALGREPETLQIGQVTFALAFGGGGSRLATHAPVHLGLFDLGVSPPADRLRELFPDLTKLPAISVTADGQRIAVANLDSSISVWDLRDRTEVWSASGHAVPAGYLTFGGELLATASNDQTLRLWHAASGAPAGRFDVDRDNAVAPVFSPDGSLVTCPGTSATNIWRCSSGRVEATLLADPEDDRMMCIAFDPRGAMIATGDSRGRVTIWDAKTYQRLRKISGMQPIVWSLAFNPSGTRLAAGSQDRTIRLLDARTGEDLLTLRGHTGSVMSLVWTPDGRTLASGSYDATVKLWTTRASGRPH